MSGILKGKVALVTGVSRSGQVGEAVAEAMAEQGAVLGIVARTQTNVETRAEELRRSGTRVMRVIRVIPLAADLSDETQVTQVVDRMMNEYGRIDTLVNLAGGLTRYKPAVEHALEDWQHEMGTNLLTHLFVLARGVSSYAGRWRWIHHQLRAGRTSPGQYGGL